jgi:hypothetical protein
MISSWIATEIRRFTGTQCDRLFKNNKAGCQLLGKLSGDSSRDDRGFKVHRSENSRPLFNANRSRDGQPLTDQSPAEPPETDLLRRSLVCDGRMHLAIGMIRFARARCPSQTVGQMVGAAMLVAVYGVIEGLASVDALFPQPLLCARRWAVRPCAAHTETADASA